MPPSVIRAINFLCTWDLRPSLMLITLAVEDYLSESVSRRLIGEYVPGAEITDVTGLNGIDSVKRRIPGMNHRATYLGPVLALADLDRPLDCPASLVREMTRGLIVSPRLLVRIAVLEIESWILADRRAIARWLGISERVVSRAPERLDDPKRALVQLASRSRNRRLREAIAPSHILGTSRTGPDYNGTVGEFVTQHWRPDAARRYAPSLNRAITRIAELTIP